MMLAMQFVIILAIASVRLIRMCHWLCHEFTMQIESISRIELKRKIEFLPGLQEFNLELDSMVY